MIEMRSHPAWMARVCVLSLASVSCGATPDSSSSTRVVVDGGGPNHPDGPAADVIAQNDAPMAARQDSGGTDASDIESSTYTPYPEAGDGSDDAPTEGVLADAAPVDGGGGIDRSAPTCSPANRGAGFSVNGAPGEAGAVTGGPSGGDTVVARGSFAGAFSQDTSNLGSAETITTDCSATISSPGNQKSVTTTWPFKGTNGSTQYSASSMEQALITFGHGAITNDGVIAYASSALPGSDVVEPYDPFPDEGTQNMPNGAVKEYWGAGVLADSDSSVVTVTNGSPTNALATISSVVSGAGAENAGGFKVMPWANNSGAKLTVDNYGTISGAYTGMSSGTAAGIWARDNGGQTIRNYPSGTVSATATYYANAIYSQSYFADVSVSADGMVSAVATGATQGNARGFGVAVGIDVFTYHGNVSVVTPGTVTAAATASASVGSYAVFLWAEGGNMSYSNSGSISATSSGGQSKTLYCGGNGGGNPGTFSLTNTGTVKGLGGGGGWAWGVENDNGNGDRIVINNSGTISHDSGLGVFVCCGANGGSATLTSTGRIYGGLEGIAAENFAGDMTLNIYGPVAAGSGAAMSLGKGNDTVTIHGLPKITGTMNGQGGTNTLDFELTGTLQSVNGAPATKGGTTLATYALGTSGSITVSGQAYTWANFNVTGKVTP